MVKVKIIKANDFSFSEKMQYIKQYLKIRKSE